jgi:hypothetical protein
MSSNHFQMTARLVFLILVTEICQVPLGCVKIAEPQTEKLTQTLKNEYLLRLRRESGLQLSDSVELLYHNKETDRSPFSEEWIIFSVTVDLRSVKLREAPLEMNDPDAIDSLIKLINSRLPTEKLEDATGSQSFDWTKASGEYRGDLLFTKKGQYLYIILFPSKR